MINLNKGINSRSALSAVELIASFVSSLKSETLYKVNMQIIFQPHLIFFILLSAAPFTINGLRCYQCKMMSNSNSTVNSCLTSAGTPKECAKTHCTIRVWSELLNSSEEKITYFHRGCENVAPYSYSDKMTLNPSEKTYYHYCSSDLCNGEDGLELLFLSMNKAADNSLLQSSVNSTTELVSVVHLPGIGNSPGESLHFGAYFSIITGTFISTIVLNNYIYSS